MIPSVITSSIIVASPSLVGPSWTSIALFVGDAVAAWIASTGFQISGLTTGASGAGVVTGALTVNYDPVIMVDAFFNAGVRGLLHPQMAAGIGIGVAAALSSSYVGTSAGVGSGTDLSAVTVAEPASLSLLLASSAAARGLSGIDIPILCAAISTGIAGIVIGSPGVGVVSGPGGPSLTTGTSLSSLV